jgi:hypothetical protein
MCLPGETEAGTAGIPARRAQYSLTESALSPFHAEPTQLEVGEDLMVIVIGDKVEVHTPAPSAR